MHGCRLGNAEVRCFEVVSPTIAEQHRRAGNVAARTPVRFRYAYTDETFPD